MWSIWALTLSIIMCGSVASAATLEGIVVDEAQRPLNGAKVELILDSTYYWVPEDVKPITTATTKPDGSFKIDAATSGAVALVASASGHRKAKFPINVDAAASRQLGLALQTGTHIRGRITDEAGNALPGVTLGPIRGSQDTPLELAERIMPEWVQSDANGQFQFSAILPNVSVTFIACKPGFEINNVRINAGEHETAFRLVRGGYAIAGNVYSKDLPSGTYSETPVRLNGNGLEMATRCGAASDFRIEGIPPGEYSLEPIHTGERQGKAVVVSFPKDDGTSVGLEIASGYYLYGTTVDFETSTAIGGVSLSMHDQVATSSQNGAFRIGPFFAGGPIDIAVDEASGFRKADLGQATEMPTADGFSDVNGIFVRVRPQRTVQVTISNMDVTTQPVIVHMHGRGVPAQRAAMQTSATELRVFQPGDYVVHARSGWWASQATTVSLQQSYNSAVELTLQPAAAIRGTVRLATQDPTSTRVRTAGVRLLSTAETSTAIKLSETEVPFGKTFSFPGLPASTFAVEVFNQSGTQRGVQTVTLSPGELRELEFQFQPGNTFSGTAVDEEQKPVSAVEIAYNLADGKSARVSTNENGRFLVEDLMVNEVVQVIIDQYAYLPFRAGPIPLPQSDYRITLKKAGLLRARIDADPSTRWKLFLMESYPWGVGTYPEQWMSRQAETANLDGGETAEMAIPGAGRYRFVAISTARAMCASEPFELKENETTGREVVFTPGGPASLSGSTGLAGAAEVTAWNTSLPEGQLESEFLTQSSNGTYQISGLPPGDYLLMAAGSNGSASAINVTLTAGENKRVDLAANQRLEIRGTVTLKGQPIAQTTIELISETDPQYQTQSTSTNSAGEFAFSEVPADTYTVRAKLKSEQDELTAQRSVTAKRGSTVPPVTLDLTPAPTVQVSIPTGVNIPAGTDITFMNTEARTTVRGQWNNGQLQAPLSPGKYEVWSGDAVAGTVMVGSGGTVTIETPAPR